MNLDLQLEQFVSIDEIKSFIKNYSTFYPFRNKLGVTYDIDNDNVSFSVAAKVAKFDLIKEFDEALYSKALKHSSNILVSKDYQVIYLGKNLNSNYIKLFFNDSYTPYKPLSIIPSNLQEKAKSGNLILNQGAFITSKEEIPLYMIADKDEIDPILNNIFKVNTYLTSYEFLSFSENLDLKKLVLYESNKQKRYDLIESKSPKALDFYKEVEDFLSREVTDISFYNINKITFNFDYAFEMLISRFGL